MTKLKAVLFDMDGTLVDSIPFHQSSWVAFLKKHGILLDPEQFQAQNHGNIDTMIKHFFGTEINSERVVQLGNEKEELYRDSYRKHIHEIDGLTGFLSILKKQKIQVALATMGDATNIDFILDSIRIRPFFQCISGGNEISKGKPDGEIYELTLKKINLKNTDCLVIEDSADGVRAARNAGIKVIGITSSLKADELIKHGCFHTISSYRELNLNFLNSSFQ
jgi:beta-phosphoglucomutase